MVPTSSKKSVKQDGARKQENSKTTASAKTEIQEIIDLHTTHLLHMDEMLTSLQVELKEIRGLIGSDTKIQGDAVKNKKRTFVSYFCYYFSFYCVGYYYYRCFPANFTYFSRYKYSNSLVHRCSFGGRKLFK